MASRLRKEEVLQFLIDRQEVIIRVGAIVELTTDLGTCSHARTGMIKHIDDDEFTFDWSEQYNSKVESVKFASVRNLKLIKQ